MIFASLICVTMAIVLDVMLLILQAALAPWRSGSTMEKATA